MNSMDSTEPDDTEDLPSDTQGVGAEPDDEFENEDLGERQAEAC